MRLKRYYRSQPIDLNGIDAIRAVLNQTITEGRVYRLEYPAEVIEVNTFDAVKEQFAHRGPPSGVEISAKSSGGRFASFDATNRAYIVLEYRSNQVQPEGPVGSIEARLGLKRLERMIRTAFVAHGFDKKGEDYARKVADFLRLVGIEPITGQPFEPNNVSDKVRRRIDDNASFFAIGTPQDDQTWIIQETTYAESRDKYPFLLIESGTTLKQGLLGDREYIAFPEGHISESFISILQGLQKLQGGT